MKTFFYIGPPVRVKKTEKAKEKEPGKGLNKGSPCTAPATIQESAPGAGRGERESVLGARHRGPGQYSSQPAL
ncbi:hypothetical protein GWI33_005659 [Rhynchophorus ferrugineus]|uniref:Uncharacterized protein n=1 Tax=Rhynchophorus ferrugineus TaxID=354439 RepID=A0A834MJM1_RHYFE|nr:hypothetical protein GWI33_005659 [Rhynchophorus ferrugineus]